MKKDLTPENHWFSSVIESLKYFLTTMYVYIMKESWTAETQESTRVVVMFDMRFKISDLSIKHCVEMVSLPADITLLLNGPTANVSSASYLCYLGVRRVCEWLPFIQRVVTVIFKSIYGGGTSLSLHLFFIFPVQYVSFLQCCNCNSWWCSLLR